MTYYIEREHVAACGPVKDAVMTLDQALAFADLAWVPRNAKYYNYFRVVALDGTKRTLIKDYKVEGEKEMWSHFKYTSGGNPYVATTEKEGKRILTKYKKLGVTVEKLSTIGHVDYYLIHDEEREVS